MNKNRENPIIILGMHRSGTTMISNIFEKMGIFMGYRKEQNSEPIFFLRINNWLLRQTNSFWDNPYNYKLLDDKERNIFTNIVLKYIKSYRKIEFFGFRNPFISFENVDFKWGWKDPRNSFTIDIWHKIFPNAKLIHIYRNPIDVAVSLKKREERKRKKFRLTWKKEKSIIYRNHNLNYGNSVRVLNLEEGIKLWREYIENIYEVEKKFNLKIHHMSYEKFLESPVENLNEIVSKLNLNINNQTLEKATKDINPNRKYAFLENNNLVGLYQKIKSDPTMESLLKKLEYHNII